MRIFGTSAVIALAVFLLVPAAARADQQWLVVSDIHLDPYDAFQRPSDPGDDSNLALFESALAAMKRAVPAPAVVMIPGDFLAHHFERRVNEHDAGSAPEAIGTRTVAAIAHRFDQTYPKARFDVVVGNNDDPCGDYRSESGGAYLKSFARAWAPLVNRAGAAPGFERAFEGGGYYTAALPVRGLHLIALNTVFFSKLYQGDCSGARNDAANRELAWLRATLAATPAGQRNVLLMHVPPGYDAVATQLARGIVSWPFYAGDSAGGFLDAVAANGARIAFGVAGHGHRFDFKLLPASPQPVPLFVFGALSPVYRNNPNFSVMIVRDDGTLRDIQTYAYDESAGRWQAAHSFVADWMPGAHQIDASALAALHESLGADPAKRDLYGLQATAWAPAAQSLWGGDWRIVWCAQTELRAGYPACAKTGDPMAWLRLAAALLPVAVLAVVLLVLVRRGRRKRAA